MEWTLTLDTHTNNVHSIRCIYDTESNRVEIVFPESHSTNTHTRTQHMSQLHCWLIIVNGRFYGCNKANWELTL